MRNRRMKPGEVDIGDTWIDTKSRDDIPSLLLGLQSLCKYRTFRPRLFALSGNTSFRTQTGARADPARDVARPGAVTSSWQDRCALAHGRQPALGRGALHGPLDGRRGGGTRCRHLTERVRKLFLGVRELRCNQRIRDAKHPPRVDLSGQRTPKAAGFRFAHPCLPDFFRITANPLL